MIPAARDAAEVALAVAAAALMVGSLWGLCELLPWRLHGASDHDPER